MAYQHESVDVCECAGARFGREGSGHGAGLRVYGGVAGIAVRPGDTAIVQVSLDIAYPVFLARNIFDGPFEARHVTWGRRPPVAYFYTDGDTALRGGLGVEENQGE